MEDPIKIPSRLDPKLHLEVIPGHFSSDRFHVNYYIDVSSLKIYQSLAKRVARAMVQSYVKRMELSRASSSFFTPSQIESIPKILSAKAQIDTIICLDGCEVIGAFVAEEMADLGFDTSTDLETTYIISPEFDHSGQMIVRENIIELIHGKHVLVVLATAMSGRTIEKSLRCIKAYGGIVEGVSVIFGNVDEICGHPVNNVFQASDIEGFRLESAESCSLCRDGKPLDAIVNSYGYGRL